MGTARSESRKSSDTAARPVRPGGRQLRHIHVHDAVLEQ